MIKIRTYLSIKSMTKYSAKFLSVLFRFASFSRVEDRRLNSLRERLSEQLGCKFDSSSYLLEMKLSSFRSTFVFGPLVGFPCWFLVGL